MDLVVRNATLVRAPGAVPVAGTTIVIRDGLISDAPAPTGARELDAAGAVVTAGFWNCHVHLIEPAWSGAARKPATQLQAALDDMFNRRGLGVDDVLAMLTTHPAAAFGTGTGTVAPGEPGDLVLLDKLATVTDLAAVRATIRAGQDTWARATTSPPSVTPRP